MNCTSTTLEPQVIQKCFLDGVEPFENQKRVWGGRLSCDRCFGGFFLPQCHGEPLSPEPQPAEQRGRPVELQDHLAGVCGGSGLLEGPATAGGHCPPLIGHRLLRQRRPALLHQPAGACALMARAVKRKHKEIVLLQLFSHEHIKLLVYLQPWSCVYFPGILISQANIFRSDPKEEKLTSSIRTTLRRKLGCPVLHINMFPSVTYPL